MRELRSHACDDLRLRARRLVPLLYREHVSQRCHTALSPAAARRTLLPPFPLSLPSENQLSVRDASEEPEADMLACGASGAEPPPQER